MLTADVAREGYPMVAFIATWQTAIGFPALPVYELQACPGREQSSGQVLQVSLGSHIKFPHDAWYCAH